MLLEGLIVTDLFLMYDGVNIDVRAVAQNAIREWGLGASPAKARPEYVLDTKDDLRKAFECTA
jgi:hypothetical protein